MFGGTLKVGDRVFTITSVETGQEAGTHVLHGTTPDPQGNPYPAVITLRLTGKQD